MGSACARRAFRDGAETGHFRRLLSMAVPIAGFVVCLYIWWSLRNIAKITGTLWLLLGLVYCAIRTRGFRKRLELSDVAESE